MNAVSKPYEALAPERFSLFLCFVNETSQVSADQESGQGYSDRDRIEVCRLEGEAKYGTSRPRRVANSQAFIRARI